MTSQVTIKREVEKLKEKTGTKKPRYIHVTLWHGLYMGDMHACMQKANG